MTDGLLISATQIYLSLVKPQDDAVARARIRWQAADEALALSEHLATMERDSPEIAEFHKSIRGVGAVADLRRGRVEVLARCLDAAGGNLKEAARLAGIKRSTFWMAAKRAGLITPKKMFRRMEAC